MHPHLNIAISAARSAGRVILRAIVDISRIQISTKHGKKDYVTNVDKSAEAEIIKVIHKAYPKHNILAEESGEQAGSDNDSPYTWIIDPLDGTTNFLHGFPHFVVSIAVKHNDVLAHGVIYDPIRDELFTASKGSGTQLNGRRIRVSACRTLETALLGTGFAYRRLDVEDDKFIAVFVKILTSIVDIRRTGSAALDLAYVASGRLDGYWEMGLKPWDMAAGALIIREAGGLVGDFNGDDKFLQSGRIAAANPKLYPLLLKELTGLNNK